MRSLVLAVMLLIVSPAYSQQPHRSGNVVAPTYAPTSQQMTVIPNQKARNSGASGGGTVIIYDQRQYHWPMFGRVRFIERDIYRQAQRKLVSVQEEANEGQSERRGLFRRLRGRRGE